MKKLALLLAIGAALLIPAAATPSDFPHASCQPVAQAPNVVKTNYAVFRGYTTGCGEPAWFSGYHYTASIIDADTGQVLNSYSGTTAGSRNLDGETWAMCLRPDGTARNVRSVLTISTNGQTRSSTSPSAQCKRTGGTAP